jgi:hypothetical protein
MARKKPVTIEKSAKQYLELKTEKVRIEKQLDVLKKTIAPYLEGFPERKAELCGFEFSLVETERENFKLSAAKEKIEAKVLSPFISVSNYTSIRTTFRGGEEA